MNIKRAFLGLAAATLLLPSLVMAGSTLAAFEVDFDFDDSNPINNTQARIICDTGLPFTHQRFVEDGDNIQFLLEYPVAVVFALSRL